MKPQPACSSTLYAIFGKVLSTCRWPKLWKRETVKIIPKTGIPVSLKDVCNISYTPLFSKVLEHFILLKLREELDISPSQFGGLAGVTDHFICETLHEILMCLEDSESAVNLLSIDFSKAFNRMSHLACINAITAKGASLEVVRVVQAFLCDRVMQVHIGDPKSAAETAPGGAPQGSVFFIYLFIYFRKGQLNNQRTRMTETGFCVGKPSLLPCD